MLKCGNCGKQYKSNHHYKNHILICKINKKELNNISALPTRKEMWYIIQKLVKEDEIKTKKIKALEDIVYKDVKNLNIVDWLNENDKGIDIELWLKNEINVTLEHLKLIFSSDYENGISSILSDNIIKNKNNPFRAFNHKIKQLYIYEKNNWKKCQKSDLLNIFDRIRLNILKRSKEYDNSLSYNQKFGSDNMEYLRNCDKIMIVDTRKKERYYKYIESSIINLVKINLNDLTKFKFSF
tara:strand:+ start:2623 stop:3339 length:717 start_codon:yes stop_codon:yes gene_type:complete